MPGAVPEEGGNVSVDYNEVVYKVAIAVLYH